jgi:hypothetical protein
MAGEVGQAELGPGAGEPDRADHPAQALLLAGDDVHDRVPALAAPGVAAPDVGRHRLEPPQLGRQAALGERGQIGGPAVGGVGS